MKDHAALRSATVSKQSTLSLVGPRDKVPQDPSDRDLPEDMSRKKDLIHRLYNLLDALEERTGFDELDPTSKELLKHIGQSGSSGRKLSITDIALNRRFGSAATLFSRLTKLEKSGWLEMRENPDDGRSRLVSLSSKSQSVFDRMSGEVKSFISKEQ